jgi:hypothetical protein
MNVDCIKIIHYTPLVERKQFLTSWFHSHNVSNFSFKDDCDRENLTQERIQKWATEKAQKRLDRGTLAVNIAWWETLEEIQNMETVLIIEDDAIFCDDFLQLFEKALGNLPDDFDIGWISDGFGFHIGEKFQQQGQWWYKSPGANRTTCGVLIKGSAAKKILENYPKFDAIVDAHLTEICDLLPLSSYWIEPTLITQGTQRGVYDSCLRNFTFQFGHEMYEKIYTPEKTTFQPRSM